MSKQTDRLHSEAKEALFTAILEIAHDAVIAIDQDNNIILFNQGAKRLFGYNASEVIGQPLDILLPSTLSEVHRAHVRRFAESATVAPAMEVPREISGRRKDGTIFPAEASIAKVSNGEQTIFTAILRDITPRKRAEETLREREHFIQRIVDVNPDLLSIYDLVEQRNIYANQEINAILGYTPEQIQQMGAGMIPNLLHPDDRSRVAEYHRDFATCRDGETREIEYRMRAANGEWRWLHSRETVFGRGADGSVKQIFGVAQDITARKHAEEAQRESEARFSNAFEFSAIGMALVAPDGRWLKVNQVLCDLVGYSEQELLTKTFQDITYPDDLQTDVEFVRQMLAGERQTYHMEKRYFHKDGHVVWILLSVSLVQDGQGQPLYFISQIQDITDRKRAEEQVRESHKRFSRLVNQLNDVIWSASMDGSHIFDLNDSFERIYGITRQQFRDNPTLWLEMVHPEDRRIAEASGNELLRAGHAEAQYRIVRPDGTIRWLHDRKSILCGKGGEPLQMGGIANDITERRQAEEGVKTQLQRLAAMRVIDTAITGTLDLQIALNVVLEQTIAQLAVDAASVLLLNPHTQTLTYAAGRGFRTRAIEQSRVRLGEGLSGRAALENHIAHCHALSQSSEFTRAALLADEGFIEYYGAPMTAKGHILGVLEVFHRTSYEADEEWRTFLETLAGQAAIAVDNARLFQDLQRSNIELSLAYNATIEGWSRALDLRDKETEGHTLRVTELTERLARAMDLPEAEIVHIRRGALLHDIGKMGVPDSILLKPDKLTDDEWVIMRRHPQLAFDMLAPIAFLRPALDIPGCHHEKWDGTGYPRGLKGEQIPLAARLFAVVDVWDALRSDRPYRQAWPEEKVREHIRGLAGTHFDPKAVEVFFKVTR